VIYLVNAGCRQAGPKILYDLYVRGAVAAKIYVTGSKPKGGNGIQPLDLEVPLKR
jgi:hypothetical protein